MEQYIVSARKYRPANFSSVVGQQALAGTLKNAIATGRLAHAYLFCGSRGVGKTSCARIFAKTINCTSRTADGEACDACDSCRQFNEGRSMNIVELDAASHNGTDDIRQLIEQVMTPPAVGRYRVFIIDEVHMLTAQAFNAFLKTLEEPPGYVVFILATTEKHKIIPTILSRCQIYDFNRISVPDMVAHMQHVAQNEGIEAETEALNVIARKADGAMRDALSIFDQVAASGGGKITYKDTIANLNVLDSAYYNRLLDAFVAQNVTEALLIYRDIRNRGFDSQFFINGLGGYLRDLAMAQNPQSAQLIEATDDVREALAKRAATLHPTFLYRAMDLCNSADFNFRQASNKQFLIELTLIKLCQLLSPSADSIGADEGQLKPLENYLAGQAPTNTTSISGTAAASRGTAPAPAHSAPPATAGAAAHGAPAGPTISAEPAAAYTAAAPHAAAAPEPRRTSYTAGRMSISGLTKRAAPQPEAAAPAEAAPKQHEAFTEADLARLWPAVTDLAAGDKPMKVVLSAATPRLTSDTAVRVRVASALVAQRAESLIPAMEALLRRELRNDDISLSFEVSDDDLPVSMWTDEKYFNALLDENPALKLLIDDFHLRRI